MKITLLTVGKTDLDWVREGIAIYKDRLSHYCRMEIVEIPALKGVSALSKDEIKTREGELILKALGPSDYVILLDERGKQPTSLEMASFLQERMSHISRGGSLVFVIGGAYGFSKAVYDRSASLLSLSRMTFSHQMVRAIFIEQLYRAFTILAGEPYHHE
ncbi:MAG: 23S rRNA (pseudouridine(1915)-N(3))-methyltransferase RlmH [Bacteroidales bacterium]|nr:23S rRNA (pseudouridine(1915)-N(3))-methyltransferase RlmH [Bacteroidales bacterium]